jgi:mRNA-degrading endonuclease toxin of MazEF toxin-antitoxin module
MPDVAAARGQIWWVDVGLKENKRFVVVSNNVRNRKLRDVVMVRLTTADKPEIPSIVEFDAGEISDTRCFAVADDVWMIGKEWLRERVGALTPAQMERVSQALRVALDL